MNNNGRPYKADGTRHTGYKICREELLPIFKEQYADKNFDFNVMDD